MAGVGGDADTGEYVVGERVFVPHVDRHYEAKVLKAEFRRTPESPDGQWFYFLHYSGWNKKYDEWVEGSGLVKAAELGLQAGGTGAATAAGGGAKGAARKKERFAAVAAAGTAAATGAAAVAGGGGGGGGKKGAFAKLAADLGAIGGAVVGGAATAAAASGADAAAAAGGAQRGLQLELDISPVLKKALLDDYDAIVTDARLVPLPRSPCVAEVLRRYAEHAAASAGPVSAGVEAEVAAGLRTYFDKALLAVLLYRSERPQALAALSSGALPSAVYGTEHLLRLFVKLPELLAAAGAGGMAEEALLQTANAVQDLMNWVAENLDALLAPREAYLDYHEYMAGLMAAGGTAEALAAAGYTAAGLAPPPATSGRAQTVA